MAFKKNRLMELAGLLSEAVVNGASSSKPAPEHRVKMNENSDLDWLEQGKSHRIDMWDAREELAALAYEIGRQIQTMHLDDSDRKTEKMTQNKLENMYKFLRKLKRLVS